MKSKYILVIGLIFAVVTAVLLGKFIMDLDKSSKSNKDMTQVVVLKQDVKANQKVTKDLLELKSYSANSVHPEAVKKIADIDGSYASVDMKAGEILFKTRFTDQFKESELITRKIQEGYRAVSVEVNYVESVSTFIEPEDYVDAVFTQNGTTSILLENIRVLAVGRRIVQSGNIPKGENGEAAQQVQYNSLTLELTPAQVTNIVNSDSKGNIRFVLRSKVAPKQ